MLSFLLRARFSLAADNDLSWSDVFSTLCRKGFRRRSFCRNGIS